MSFSVLRSPLVSRTLVPFPHIVNLRTFHGTAYALKATGSLPTFLPTSNTELDTLLNTIRDELFIPSHLLLRQRNLMNREKNHFILEEEPLSVEIAGEVVELKPKSRAVPIPVKLFTQALQLMKTPTDLDAIPGLLQGFSQANRPIRQVQLEMMARIINMNGRIDLLMKIARGAGENGFKFTTPTAKEFMRGVKMQSMLPDKASVMKALKNAEALFNILGESGMKVDPNERLKRNPVVVGTLLSMFTNASIRFNEGKDYDGYTHLYTDRLKLCWREVEWEQDLVEGKRLSFWRAKHAVLDHSPVLEGLFQARDILQGTVLIPWLEAESARLNNSLGEWKNFLSTAAEGKAQPYGMHSYKDVVERLGDEMGIKMG